MLTIVAIASALIITEATAKEGLAAAGETASGFESTAMTGRGKDTSFNR